jgi:hypothetical protein
MRTNTLLLASVAATSAAAVSALAQVELQPLWSLNPGSRSYLTTDNTQRGMDYNPLTGNVLLVNRAGGLQIVKLNANTGAEVGTMSLSSGIISGGTFAGSMLGVADDGAIYLGNLSTDTLTTPFKLYRWADENATPTVAFSGDPSAGFVTGVGNSKRFGDTLDVRGAGDNTQVLLAARGGGDAAVLITSDGLNFTGLPIDTDAGDGDIGLGVALGSGNTFWGTALGRTLRHIDVNTGVSPFAGTTVGNFGAADGVPTSLTIIGVDVAHGWLAGIDLVAGPDKVHLFDIKGGTPVLLDTETLPVDNTNGNGVGSVAFGGGMLFVLDTNNGLHAFQVIPEPSTYALLGFGLGALWWVRRRS